MPKYMPQKDPPEDEQVPLMSSDTSGNPLTFHHKANEMASDLNSVNISKNTLYTKPIVDNEVPSPDMGYTNSQGRTVPMLAIKVTRTEQLQVQIEDVADPKLKGYKGISAFPLCLTGELYSYFEVLLRQSMNSVDSMCQNLVDIRSILRRCNINKQKDKNKYDYWCSISNIDPRLITVIKTLSYVFFNYINGKTPLMHAVRCHYDDCVRLLLLAGADVNKINKNKETTLTIAMTRSHNPILKDLIRAGALRRHPRDETSTLNFGMFKKIPDYLQHNGLLNMAEIYVKMPLMYAAERGDKACVMYSVEMYNKEFLKRTFLLDIKEKYVRIVEYGFDTESVLTQFDVKDARRMCKNSDEQLLEDKRRGYSTCISAIQYYDFLNEEITKPLLGDTHRKQYKDGKTALMIAISNYNGGSHSHIEPLIGDSCSVQDNDGKTALMYALINNKLIPDYLLEQMIGDSQNLKDKDGKTSLMYAFINKQRISENILQMMIGNSQNTQDNDGKTALMHAFIHKKQPSKKLICHLSGEIPFIQDNTGKTALMYAFKSNYYMRYSLILKLLGGKVDIRDKDGNTLLMYALKFYKNITEEIANLLVCDTQNDRYEHGKTALMVALENNNYRCISNKLIPHFNCSFDVQDNSGQTALMYAMKYKSHIPEYLLEQLVKDSQFVQDNEGKTALMHASIVSYSSNLNNFTIKLFHKDTLNMQDNEGKTALHHSIEHDQPHEFMEELILHGSNLEIKDKQRRTALDMCLEIDTREDVFLCEWRESFIKTKALLKYKPIPILGLLGKQILLTFIQRGKFSLNNLMRDKEIFRLMVINVIEPFPHLWAKISAFFAALKENLIDVVKYLIANMYLTNEDLILLIKAKHFLKSNEYLKENQMSFNGSHFDLNSNDLQHLITEATSQPWPLVKLSFVVVSSAVGHGTNREDRVKRLPVPNPIKDSLMFNTRTALIPVSEWSNIPMVFDPVEYEKTRRPRPLLNYWPFGAELVF